MPPNTLSTDVFLNKTNLLIAQNQRLIASWLPPARKAERTPRPKSNAEIESEEQEIFNTPMPELFGVGAKPPKDGEVRREELSSNERLRKQLLGKDYAKKQNRSGTTYGEKPESEPLRVGSKPKPQPTSTATKRVADEDSEGDEGGRSSLGKSVKRNRIQPEREPAENSMAESNRPEETSAKAEAEPLKNASNYLDEVLADRSLKKRKKSKKKKKPQVTVDAASNAD